VCTPVSIPLPQPCWGGDGFWCKTPGASDGKRVIVDTAHSTAKCFTERFHQHASHERIGKGRLIYGWEMSKLRLNEPPRVVRHPVLAYMVYLF